MVTPSGKGLGVGEGAGSEIGLELPVESEEDARVRETTSFVTDSPGGLLVDDSVIVVGREREEGIGSGWKVCGLVVSAFAWPGFGTGVCFGVPDEEVATGGSWERPTAAA